MSSEADRQYATISKKDRKSLGITKKNFRKDFAKELKEIRKISKKK